MTIAIIGGRVSDDLVQRIEELEREVNGLRTSQRHDTARIKNVSDSLLAHMNAQGAYGYANARLLEKIAKALGIDA